MEPPSTMFKIENRLLSSDEIKQLATLIIDEPDHYTALGVDRRASAEEINQSYCIAVNYFHPLKYQSIAGSDSILQWTLSRAFRRIEQAYFVLSSRTRRKDYDAVMSRRVSPACSLPRQEESAIRKGNAEIWRALSTSRQTPDTVALSDTKRSPLQESRRVTRMAIQIPVIVTLENHWHELTESCDISPLGIKLALAHPVAPGALVGLELPMPVSLRTRDFEAEIYKVKAYVLYITEGREKRMVAAEFV